MTSNSTFPHEWHQLFSAALNGTLSPEEKTRLNELLHSTPAARQLWFLYTDNECALAELRPRVLTAQVPTARLAWLSWRPLAAAAAGVVLGLAVASLTPGSALGYNSRGLVLLQEGFESGPAPLTQGMPAQADVWSGDYSQVVGAQQDVRPMRGEKMLRFLRADYLGKPGRDGYVADLYRIIDLTRPELQVVRGDAWVSVEAGFRALPQGGVRRGHCGVTVYALDALPPEGEHHEVFIKRRDNLGLDLEEGPSILASTTRQDTIPVNHMSWQTARGELRLPPGTRYLMIHLHQSLAQPFPAKAEPPVEFTGLFVDDVRVTLVRRPPLP